MLICRSALFSQQQQQQRSERSFRGRAYPVDHSKKDINYADLQLPKTSNNGSMKKSNKSHMTSQHHPHHLQPNIATPRPTPTIRTDYAEIQFKPKTTEQAEV